MQADRIHPIRCQTAKVKGDNKIEVPVVQTKQSFAEQIAAASGMTYKVMRGSEATHGSYEYFFNGEAYLQTALKPF